MDEITMQSYERMAAAYERETAKFWTQFPCPFIADFIAEFQGRRLLDAGSGNGRDGLIFRDHGLEPICLDASAAMVALCTQKQLTAIQADLLSLPFGEAEFDGVWSYTSLLHIRKQDTDQSLAEMRRVLKPDGILGLGLIEGDTEEYRDTKGDGNLRWFSYFTSDEVHELLERHGFKVAYFDKVQPGTRKYLHFIGRKI